jgi:hypothetical protein
VLSEWELWAIANFVIEQHCDHARAHAIEQLEALATADDTNGVAAWPAILDRIEQLQAKPDALQ